jgi:hypothetical protein
MQFERKFYEQQGSGLGLVIASGLPSCMGEMQIESTPGQRTKCSHDSIRDRASDRSQPLPPLPFFPLSLSFRQTTLPP